ncbi:hypothetical protein OAO87_01820 [bacterium]|nr:hypothetical protein [bacterium]
MFRRRSCGAPRGSRVGRAVARAGSRRAVGRVVVGPGSRALVPSGSKHLRQRRTEMATTQQQVPRARRVREGGSRVRMLPRVAAACAAGGCVLLLVSSAGGRDGAAAAHAMSVESPAGSSSRTIEHHRLGFFWRVPHGGSLVHGSHQRSAAEHMVPGQRLARRWSPWS